ncbi:hypothetical protein BC827DRAFT_1245787 [Russula dissimulans]|nr:hypothetical protein BC827DRAFT_1245787 [Russula dissimulans]
MMMSKDLIQSNSQIYRVYYRRLANPADQDIFITSAIKLTAFFSDVRAYYSEAQRPIIEILEVACDSLKNVMPSVFSKPGSLDRSVVPPEKATLFSAFDKLVNSVRPHVPRFTDPTLRNRLVSLLSSIGVLLPPGTTDATSQVHSVVSQIPPQAPSVVSPSQAPAPANAINPVPMIPASLPMSSVAPPPSSVPPVLPSSQNISTTPSVTSSPDLTPKDRDSQSMLPPLVSAANVGVAHVPQSAPPSHVQAPVQAAISDPASSDQQNSIPIPRRRSSGLDFLQLDLKVAREKKLKAAAFAAEAHKSVPTTHQPVPSTSSTVPLVAMTASPTSTTIAGTTPVLTSAVISSESNTASSPLIVQTTSPTLVHRNLRQGSTRATFVGSHKLRITDRAPAPAPEPGSSSAPIVIDEDDEPTSTPADQPMEVDAPTTQALPNKDATPTVLDQQDVQGSNGDAQNDIKPQPDQVISELLPEDNASATQVESRPLVSEHELSATRTPQVGVMAIQSPSVPSTSVPLSSFATARPATPPSPSKTLAPSDSISGDASGVQLQPAVDNNARGNIVEDTVGSFGSSTIEIVAAPKAKDTGMTPPDAATISSTAIMTESSPTLVTSPDADRPNPLLNVAEPSRTVGDEAPNVEGQQDLSTTQSDIVGSSAIATVSLGVEPLADVGGATEMVAGQVPSVSSLNPTIAVLGTRTCSRGSSVSSASSDSRSVSPPPGNKFSDSGNVQVKAEELEEDEMVDELAPLFGKEMSVICMDRAYDIPAEFTWNFTLSPADWDRVSQWVKAPECLDLDISQAKCVTLACYSMQELDPYANQGSLAREQWFENVKPVPWAKVPHHLWAIVNDKFTVVFPPYMSPDDLFDVSPFLQPGPNKILFTQNDGMADYILVLHDHHPTRGQLVPLHARWDMERRFREQLQLLARPFIIEEW